MRVGRNNRPAYRIVATDARSPRDGKIIENIGFYDPLVADQAKQITLDAERAKYWLSVGAQPSETVTSILKKQGIKGSSK
jgi:small subunit ribosomal protein S16